MMTDEEPDDKIIRERQFRRSTGIDIIDLNHNSSEEEGEEVFSLGRALERRRRRAGGARRRAAANGYGRPEPPRPVTR